MRKTHVHKGRARTFCGKFSKKVDLTGLQNPTCGMCQISMKSLATARAANPLDCERCRGTTPLCYECETELRDDLALAIELFDKIDAEITWPVHVLRTANELVKLRWKYAEKS